MPLLMDCVPAALERAMHLDLRLATHDDLPAVEGIVHAAYAHYVPRMGREPGPMLDDYAALIAEGRVHVLDQGGTVQGILVLIPQDDAMLLDNIAVAPGAQGQGLGRRMLAFAEHVARQAGYGAIKLYTHEAMTENIGLYSRIGYSETHRVEEKGLRRVYMLKHLLP
jgi:ribosomal protein S18 acetylase RimI-like enzyme